MASTQLDLGITDVHTPRSLIQTPKLTEASLAIVRKDGKILTVSRPEPPHEMSLPGGHVDPGETSDAAAKRELQEETGLYAHEVEPLQTIRSPVDGRTVHVFEAKVWSGEARAAEPNTRIAWLTPKELLNQSVLYRKSVREMMRAHSLRLGDVSEMADQVALISAAKRNSLPESSFALPAQRKYPLDSAARTRNAAARLEQMKKRGKVSDSEYSAAKGRIAKAAKRFGIESEYNASDKPTPTRIHVRADIVPGGRLSVRHMSDQDTEVYLSPVLIPVDAAD